MMVLFFGQGSTTRRTLTLLHRRPVDRAAGAALGLIDLTHVRVYSRATHNDLFSSFLLSNDQTKTKNLRSDKNWRLLALLSSPITSTNKSCSQTENKGHASALPTPVEGSSCQSSSKVKNKDRWTTNAIDRTVSVEQTERALSRKA